MGPQEQSEILQHIGRHILSETEDPWSRIVLDHNALVSMTTSSITLEQEDGRAVETDASTKVDLLLHRLRDGMYQPGKGTWFSMRYEINPPGSFSVEFDYDNPPKFAFKVDPRSFYQDMRNFPRHAENTPDWLKDEIRSAISTIREEESSN